MEVDHIQPVSDGGLNEIDNLISACFNCNRGKAARSLTSVPKSLRDKAADVEEKENQLRGYHEILEAKRLRLELHTRQVCDLYERLEPGYELSERSLLSVRHFVEKLGVHDVLESLTLAWSKRFVSDEFKYFCGICWRKIRASSEESDA